LQKPIKGVILNGSEGSHAIQIIEKQEILHFVQNGIIVTSGLSQEAQSKNPMLFHTSHNREKYYEE